MYADSKDCSLGYFKQSMLEKSLHVSEIFNWECHLLLPVTTDTK